MAGGPAAGEDATDYFVGIPDELRKSALFDKKDHCGSKLTSLIGRSASPTTGMGGTIHVHRYFRNDAATSRAFERGFFRTGDLAQIDDEGFRSVIGRAGDLIRSGGEWVSPAEVESVLQSHPAIADAAVVGAVDSDWGQIVTAYVVARTGQSVTLDTLRAHCASRLARTSIPAGIVLAPRE
jgi:acyl-CoA synthetase (AMP-forming)/AMP-acid ligase II